ncbi:hypothetical protein C8A00DRAFT_18058, partial [Chaetomidium leptoderma]
DAAEAEFFSKGIWTTLKASQLGVATLRVRLSNVLRDQVLKQLPGVLEDVTAGVDDCKDILARLGTARATVTEQRRYLLKVSAGFSNLARAAIDGVYTDASSEGRTTGAFELSCKTPWRISPKTCARGVTQGLSRSARLSTTRVVARMLTKMETHPIPSLDRRTSKKLGSS